MGNKVAGPANHSNQQREQEAVEGAENQPQHQRGVTQRMKNAAARRAEHGSHSGGHERGGAHGSSFQ
jgi:hypothetical protein